MVEKSISFLDKLYVAKSFNRVLPMGLFQKKIRTGGLRICNFQGYERNSMWNFQGLIKNEVEFQRVGKKNNMEFPWVFVFGLGISKGSNTIL